MKVIIDTNVWSHVLRRQAAPDETILTLINQLLFSGLIVFIGPIRQELLTGFNQPEQFEKLKLHLRRFSDFKLQVYDYEKAAEFQTMCIKKGVQGSPVDFLICAVAYNNNFQIFTLDGDFTYYQKHISIQLYRY